MQIFSYAHVNYITIILKFETIDAKNSQNSQSFSLKIFVTLGCIWKDNDFNRALVLDSYCSHSQTRFITNMVITNTVIKNLRL